MNSQVVLLATVALSFGVLCGCISSHTTDQLFTCGSANDHFTVNFGAKTVKSDGGLDASGEKVPFKITDVSITDGSISFVQRLNQNLGGTTVVLAMHVNIDRKNGTYTVTNDAGQPFTIKRPEDKSSPKEETCTVSEVRAR